MNREKHRMEENLRLGRKRYETQRDAELSGEYWLPSEDEKLTELYEQMRMKKIKQSDIAGVMGKFFSDKTVQLHLLIVNLLIEIRGWLPK